MKLSEYFMWIAAIPLVISLVLNSIEFRYFRKHRKELTHLLYGYDPWDEKFSWSDQFLMSPQIWVVVCNYYFLKKIEKKMIARPESMMLAKNIYKNGNHLKLWESYKSLIRLELVYAPSVFLTLLFAGTGYVLDKFYGL